MTEFERKVYEIVKTIPYGQVMTYKEVAIHLGNEKLCRAVGNALHKNPNHDEIPCHRVVNSKYELSGNFAFGGPDGQKGYLEAEGLIVKNNKVIVT